MDLDDYVKNKLIINNNLSILDVNNNQEEYTKWQINKRLELIMKIHDSLLRSEQLVKCRDSAYFY